ncbi:hypothetical protein AAMO2058_000333700 [Amorphochlora amoebiformis]
MSKTVAIHWFRKGLRIHDNPALMDACKGALLMYPLFILDPYFAKPDGKPKEVLPRLFSEWKVNKLTWEFDTEPYARMRDNDILKLAKSAGVETNSVLSHTLYHPEALLSKNMGQSTTSYSAFQKIINRLGPPPFPLPTPKCSEIPSMSKDITGIPDNKYTVPELEDLGYPALPDPNPCPFRGGESEALSRLEKQLKRKKWIASFQKPKTSPNSLQPSTTVLSPYLKFGCLSVRKFWHEIQDIYSEYPGHAKPPVSLEGQLYWREFFYLNSYATPNFDKMKGNPICRQVPWDDNKQYLAAWEEAKTGYPFIDAIMTQLKTEGWIHHLARHMVACFLTRGDLWQSWEKGARVFDRLLLDADWAINNGNWMWLSCSCFFYQYFRCYSPVAFGKKTDKNGDYIRKYLPQLNKYPAKYIYEPWKAPKGLQQKWGCVIGKDYPEPIVMHSTISKENMNRMAEAYKEHKASQSKSKSTTSSGSASPKAKWKSRAKAKNRSKFTSTSRVRKMKQTKLPVAKKLRKPE